MCVSVCVGALERRDPRLYISLCSSSLGEKASLLCALCVLCVSTVESNSGVLNHNTTTQKKGKRGAVRRYCHVDCTLKALGLSLMGFFERLFLGAEAVTVPTYKIPGGPLFFFCLRRHFFS